MSEHKYRIWDAANKKHIYFNLRNLVGHWSGSVFDCETQVDISHAPDIGETTLISEAPIMKCTGLRDNKSVDIYDGDIVEVDYLNLKNNYFTVYFGDYMSEYYHMTCWLLKNDEDLIPLSLAVPCKVIGNMYENPELLEGK